MKSAIVFLIGMYLHLLMSFCVVIGAIPAGWTSAAVGRLLMDAVLIGIVHLCGWVCVVSAFFAFHKGQAGLLRRGLIALKLCSIPFYLINFLFSLVVYAFLAMGTLGFGLVLVPIPIGITCLLIFQSGLLGICYILTLRESLPEDRRPSRLHCVLQLIPVLDVADSVFLLHRYRSVSPNTKSRLVENTEQ